MRSFPSLAHRALLLALGALLTAGPAPAGPAQGAGGPRPISPAERQAVVLASSYLAGGAAAWWDELADTAPLRSLGREAAIGEIAVRAGDAAHARWRLETTAGEPGEVLFDIAFPSGVDETLLLDLVRVGKGWKIRSLRVSAEPTPSSASGPTPGPASRTPANAQAPPPPAPPRATEPRWWLPSLRWLLGSLAFFSLAAGSWFHSRRRRSPAVAMLVAAAIAALAALAGPSLMGSGPARTESGTARPPLPFAELRSLAPLRRALTSSGTVPPGLPPPAPGTAAARTARLWEAQGLLATSHLKEVAAILQGLPQVGTVPLAARLRARLAFLQRDEVPAALAYEDLLTLSPPHDGLLLEAAQAFGILGFEKRFRRFLDEALTLGSRQADVYYAAARLAIVDHRPELADRHFLAGWRLEPLERGDVLRDPLLVAELDNPSIRRTLDLGSPREPDVPCNAAAAAIALPPGFEAHRVGSLLRFSHGETEVLVPGGCGLAPVGTLVEDPVAARREEEEKALDRLGDLLAANRTGGALAQPALRRETEVAARALARRHRWGELAELTAGLAGEQSGMPADLARLRAEALRQTGRLAEATELLVRTARGAAGERRADAATLGQLADLLLSEGRYDLALRVATKADAALPFTPSGDRIRQIRLEKRLAETFSEDRTAHFDLRFPRSWHPQTTRQAERVLEGQWQRLQAWIPTPEGDPIEVHFLPVDDFLASYSSDIDILGFYDGKIRVPFGEVGAGHPLLASVLTHELAHAMIARATDDRAPHWFQEGLAQHLQGLAGKSNPIPGYKERNNLLAFPLLEPTLQGFAHPAYVMVAYDEADWALHYIEARYGRAGIRRLLEAFREGQTTDEAVPSALGKTVDELDHDLWKWCLEEAPEVWPPAGSRRGR